MIPEVGVGVTLLNPAVHQQLAQAVMQTVGGDLPSAVGSVGGSGSPPGSPERSLMTGRGRSSPRHLELARRSGAFSALPVALTDACSSSCSQAGSGVATSLAAESDAILEATGSHLTLLTSIVLAN